MRPTTIIRPPNKVGNTADGGPPDPPPPTGDIYTGVSMFAVSQSSVAAHDGAGGATWEPLKKLESIWINWNDVELTDGVFDWTGTQLDDSISDAHGASGDDYRLILRVAAGADSPISSNTSRAIKGWMATHSTRPAGYVTTMQNERNPVSAYKLQCFIPLAWDLDYQFYFDRFMKALRNRLNGACPVDASHSRKDHIFFIPVSMPTEAGTEMSIGFGQVAQSWLTPSGSLSASLSASDTLIQTIGLSFGTLPTNVLMVISPGTAKEEFVYAKKNPASGRFDVNADGRGWNRYNAGGAQTHAIGEPVYIANEATTCGTSSAPATFNFDDGRGILSGIFDHVNLNMRQWERVTPPAGGGSYSVSNLRTWWGDAWETAVIMMMDIFPADVRIGWAGAGLFNVLTQSIFSISSSGENMSNANRILDKINGVGAGSTDREYGLRLICNCTNFSADSATQLYEDIHQGESAWLLKGKNYGHYMGGQTEGVSVWPNGPEFVYAIEDAITKYGFHYVEIQSGRFTDGTQYETPAAGGWPGGQSTLRNYLLQHVTAAVQDRLPS